MNELNFTYGALITNIQNKSGDWSMGDHRGDRQMYFKRSHIRFLTKNELEFVKDLVSLNVKYVVSASEFTASTLSSL